MTAGELLKIWSCSCEETDDCEQCYFKEICPLSLCRTIPYEAIVSFLERAEKRFGETIDHFRDVRKTVTENAGDPVNHPSHYETGKFECFDVMREVYGDDAVREFCLCNAFKYLYRCKHKGNKEQDVKKAVWYLNKMLEMEDDKTDEEQEETE